MTRFVLALALAAAAAQASFEQTVADLRSADVGERLRAARMLKQSAYPEAALPLASALRDSSDDVQLEAVAGELNIFLIDERAPQRRASGIVEHRDRIVAESAFAAGPFVLGAAAPLEVVVALRAAAHDGVAQVAVEALYAFGTLAGGLHGAPRRELLRATGPDLAPMLGTSDLKLRLAAVRVLGRLFEQQPLDEPINLSVGDALITSLNDPSVEVRIAAMRALGSMRYLRALQALTDLFRFNARGREAEAALGALARIAHASSAPLFVSQLASRSPALKVAAIEGLARLGDRARAADIESALLGERNDSVLLAARFSAILLQNRSIDPVVEELTRDRLRQQALAYIVEIAPGQASAFSRFARDPDTRIRAGVADALGLSGDAGALEVVERMVQDPDPQVARAAEIAVVRLRAATQPSS
jgi:HEAT repeat protein